MSDIAGKSMLDILGEESGEPSAPFKKEKDDKQTESDFKSMNDILDEEEGIKKEVKHEQISNNEKHEDKFNLSSEMNEEYKKLNELGKEIGFSDLEIISGKRDPIKNFLVGGKPNSKHLTGNGMDVLFADGDNSLERWHKLNSAYRKKYPNSKLIWGGNFKDNKGEFNHFAVPERNVESYENEKYENVKDDYVKERSMLDFVNYDEEANEKEGAITQLRFPETYKKIPEEFKYNYDTDTISKIIETIDYGSNIARSGVHALQVGESPLKNMKQAIDKERYVGVRTIKENMGIPTFDKGEGADLGDIPDFLVEFPMEVVLDPLTFVSGFASKAIKGVSAAKEIITGSRIGKAVETELIKQMGIGTMGATYGVANIDKNDTLEDKLKKAGIGAGAAITGRNVLKYAVAPVGKKGLEKLAEKTLESRAGKFGINGYKKTKEMAENAIDRIRNHRLNYIQKFLSPTENLTQEQKYKFYTKYSDSFQEANKYRNTLWHENIKSMSHEDFKKFTGKNYYWASKGKQFKDIDPDAWDRLGLDGKWKDEDVISRFKEYTQGDDVNSIIKLRKIGIEIGEDKELYPIYGSLNTKESNELGRELTKKMNENTDDIIGRNFKGEEDAVIQAVAKYNKQVPEIVNEINEYMEPMLRRKAEKEGLDPDKYIAENKTISRDIFIPNVAEQDEFIFTGERTRRWRASTLQTNPKHRKVLGLAKKGKSISPEEVIKEREAAIKIYARKTAAKTMEDEEIEAILKIMRFNTPDSIPSELIRLGDNITSASKMTMLLTNLRWFAVNHFDNTFKAFADRGLIDAIKTALPINKNIRKDVWNLVSGKLPAEWDDPLTKYAVNNGLLDSNMVGEVINKDVTDEFAEFFMNKGMKDTDIAVKQNDRLKTFFGRINRKLEDINTVARRFYTGKISIGRVNNFIENYAKLQTMRNVYENSRFKYSKGIFQRSDKPIGNSKRYDELVGSLIRNEKHAPEKAYILADDHLKKEAMDVARDTFFDYNKSMNLFESEYARRIFPFYSFIKNNTEFWADVVTDPVKAVRMKILDKQIFGDRDTNTPISPEQRNNMTDYLKDERIKKIDESEAGLEISYGRSISSQEALKLIGTAVNSYNNLDDVGKTILRHLSPVIKAGYELSNNKDLFVGGNLKPSTIENEGKYLYSRGFQWWFAQELVKWSTGKGDLFGVVLDDNKNPVATSDMMVQIDHIMKFLSFIPYAKTVEQISGQAGKWWYQDKEFTDAVYDLISPTTKTIISPGMMKHQKIQNANDGEYRRDSSEVLKEKIKDTLESGKKGTLWLKKKLEERQSK